VILTFHTYHFGNHLNDAFDIIQHVVIIHTQKSISKQSHKSISYPVISDHVPSHRLPSTSIISSAFGQKKSTIYLPIIFCL